MDERVKRYNHVTVHYRGADDSEEVQRYADVALHFMFDGWVHVNRHEMELAAYPPGRIIMLSQ